MAWTLLAMKVDGEPPPLDEATEDQFLPLGERDAVRNCVSESFSGTDWSDPTCGHFVAEDETYTLTFSVLPKEPFLSMGINVRGGQESIPPLVEFARSNGWQLFDCSLGDWLDLDAPSSEGWRGYDALRHGRRPE